MLLNQTQVKELVDSFESFQGQDIVVTSDNIVDEDGILLESAEFVVNDKIICLMDRENLDKLDICLDSVAEVHIVFSYLGDRVSLLNLV